jgi:hypothetical protein
VTFVNVNVYSAVVQELLAVQNILADCSEYTGWLFRSYWLTVQIILAGCSEHTGWLFRSYWLTVQHILADCLHYTCCQLFFGGRGVYTVPGPKISLELGVCIMPSCLKKYLLDWRCPRGLHGINFGILLGVAWTAFDRPRSSSSNMLAVRHTGSNSFYFSPNEAWFISSLPDYHIANSFFF